MSRLKLMIAAAVKAKRTWDRIPPEHRRRALEGAKTTVKTHGPIVARKAAETARTQGPIVARKAAETARTQAPIIARRIAQAVEKARQAAHERQGASARPQDPKAPQDP
jgi:hypothetical protein